MFITNKEFMECYSTIVNIVSNGNCFMDQGKDVEEEYVDFFRDKIALYIQTLLQTSPLTLPLFNRHCANYIIIVKWLNSLFQYINRMYLQDQKTCLVNIGYTLFKDLYLAKVLPTLATLFTHSLEAIYHDPSSLHPP